MSDEIRFTGKKGKEVKFEVGEKVKNKLKKADKKAFKPLFDAIEKFDGKKGISEAEFQMLKDLQTIFANTGANQGTTGYILDAEDAKIATEFANSGKNIKDFIAGKLAEINTPKEITPVIENKPTVATAQVETTQVETVQEAVGEEVKKVEAKEEVTKPKKKSTVTPESKAKSFNRAMQNSAKRYNSEDLAFTQEITIKEGDTLYKIAEQALNDEGTRKPTRQQVNERIAQIVAMNPQIKDVNNIDVNTKIKVGKGTNDSVQRNQDRKISPNDVRRTGTVPVEKPTSEYLSDSAKIIELLGADGKKYANAVKDKPELKAELEADYKYLIDKFNNDEYLTLDEQKIFDVLKKSLDVNGEIITSNYPDKIKELEISAESTLMVKAPDLTGYKKEDTKVTVGEGDNAKEVTVSKYTKDGAPDIYQVHYKGPFDGKEYTVTASSQEDVLKLKADLEEQALNKPGKGKNLSEEEKRANLEKLIKIAELRPTEYTFELIAETIKDSTLINKNDPDAKALVQKLLLTRNGAVISKMIKDSNCATDNTLFDSDPVALKTMAAMYKEIRAKEKAGERLTPEEIKLKDTLKHGMSCFYTDSNGKCFYYDNTGLYKGGTLANNPQLSRDFDAEMETAGNDVAKKQAVINKFISDPRTKEDEKFKYYLAEAQFENATPADQKAIVEMSDARSLANIDLSKLGGTDEEKKAVKDAYVAKAKELFNYAQTENGAKLDPSNAEYLYNILNEIDKMNEETNGTDPDDAVIAEILNNFFVTEGEGENQTVKIKDFRRFTNGEMFDLAIAVANYGTEAQKAVLADMITPDEMEDGQFVRAIENGSGLGDAVRAKYESFVENMTTKEELFALIDKMGKPGQNLPFDKIMEKFGDDPEVQAKLLQNASFADSKISSENRDKLAKSVMQVDEKGNITFDKTNLPEGVTVQDVINILPKDCNNGDFAKMYKAIFMTCDLSNNDVILLMNDHLAYWDNDMYGKVAQFSASDAVKKGTEVGNSFIAAVCTKNVFNENDCTKIYNNATTAGKRMLIENKRVSDAHVIVKKGDSIDKIVKEYLKKHLDKFPKLQSSVKSDKTKWTDKRIEEALNYYMQDFRNDIMADLGITDPTKLKEGDIIELDEIKWDDHQPKWFNYNFRY